jgi:GNAT superfamily N-acetyltransferase
VITELRPERPDLPECADLINELQAHLATLYPPASQHGFSIQRLVDEQVAFFLLRCDGQPAACGGVKLYAAYAEIKRVYVRPSYRGLGLSKLIMQRLQDHAAENGIKTLRLETGIYQPEALSLYERMGYQKIEPFGEYHYDPLSLCYEKIIA